MINGDFNFLLDREIQKVSALPTKINANEKEKVGCNSTNHSSTSKSPLAAYTDSHKSYDFLQAGLVTSKKGGSTISQRSSFDDSLNTIFANEINLNPQDLQVEVSPGKIGDGLFSSKQQQVVSEEALSSEEENLIAESTNELINLVGTKARPSFLTRFGLTDNLSEEERVNESSNSHEVDDCASRPRRLRVFHDITQRSAGESNEAAASILIPSREQEDLN